MKGTISIGIVAALAIGWATASAADTSARWDLELEPMLLRLLGSGDSVNAASQTVRVFDGAVFGPVSQTNDIDVDLDDLQFALRGEIQRRRDDEWGYGVMGWWYGADDSVRANPVGSAVPNAIIDAPGATLAGVFVPSLSIVNTGSGTGGLFEDGLLNQLAFQAESEFDVWKIDLHGIRKWIIEPEKNVDILFGLELAELDTNRNETVTNLVPRVADPTVTADITVTSHQADAEYGIAFGPMVGLQGERRWRERHRFRGLLTQSILFADLDSDAVITQTTQTQASSNGAITTLGTTTLGTSNDDGWTIVPVTEAKLQYTFDVTENTNIGAGAFLSVWWDADLAPAFQKDESEVLVFLGLFFSAQMRFD